VPEIVFNYFSEGGSFVMKLSPTGCRIFEKNAINTTYRKIMDISRLSFYAYKNINFD